MQGHLEFRVEGKVASIGEEHMESPEAAVGGGTPETFLHIIAEGCVRSQLLGPIFLRWKKPLKVS